MTITNSYGEMVRKLLMLSHGGVEKETSKHDQDL